MLGENERQWKMKKAKRNTSNKIHCEHNDIFSTKHETGKFHLAVSREKNVQKSVLSWALSWARAELFFFLLLLLFFAN